MNQETNPSFTPVPETEEDEMRDSYDASVLKKGVRGRFYEQYKSGTNLALIDPDLRLAFPTDEAVNTALRSLLKSA